LKLRSAKRIKRLIKSHLKAYAKTRLIRTQMKLYTGLSYLGYSKKVIAINRSVNMVNTFFIRLSGIENVRELALKFYKGVVRIQREWKSVIELDKIRKRILEKIWNKAKKKLTKQNTNKGKRYAVSAKAIENMSQSKCTKAINEYFIEEKVKFHIALNKWFALVLFGI